MKKIHWFIAILITIPTLSFAQEMSVKSFHLAETDLTANTPGTMVYDQNGNVCALIKVETTVDGFTFDVGSLGICDVKRVGGELWVYVPYGIRKISLSHSQLGIIRDYQLPCSIEKGRTYIMRLIAGTVRTIIEHTASKQFLLVELNPKEAILEINNKIRPTDKGIYQELLPFGHYQYKAYCNNYHNIEGSIDICNPDNIHSLNIKLKPAFGYISFNANNQAGITGAAIYIDDKYVGDIPINNIQIESGTHRLRVIKELYEAYNTTFEITDEERKQISPFLNPDFAEVNIITSDGADIYINDTFMGKKQWAGKLSCSSYIIETRQQGHIPYKTTYEITRNDHNKKIVIDGPTPIYGSLAISSSPIKSKVYIDGIFTGETPMFISKQIIGTHNISVKMDGYQTQTQTITIAEGNESSISFTLEKVSSSSTKNSNFGAYHKPKTYNSDKQFQERITFKVGDIITEKSVGANIEKWEHFGSSSNYVQIIKNGKQLVAKKTGYFNIWGYINGSPKMLYIRIVNSALITLSTKKFKIRIGDNIIVKLPEGNITRWEHFRISKNHVIINQDILEAKKAGSIEIWGYVNGSPKLFDITIIH